MEEETQTKKLNWKYFFKDEKGRAILFFGFYFVFFLVLIILARSSNDKLNNVDKNNTNSTTYNNILKSLEQKNYHFKYTLLIDTEETIYEGDKYNKKQIFTYSYNNETYKYYVNDNTTMMYINDKWKTSSSPYIYEFYYDEDLLNQLLNEALEDSVTSYKNGDKVYNYIIENKKLDKIYKKEDTSIQDGTNKISLYITNGNLTKIEMDMTSYTTINNSNIKKMNLILEYSKFNEIEDIYID